uniref:40S ribosomal protein S7 n=1 Tax=Rhizophora mucronata TaxID=61149 RepID=A0A2P2KXK2_RHIMU
MVLLSAKWSQPREDRVAFYKELSYAGKSCALRGLCSSNISMFKLEFSRCLQQKRRPKNTRMLIPLNLRRQLLSQMDISGNSKAVVVYVPYRLRKAFRKIHSHLVRELEKKFNGKVCVVLLSTCL